MARNGKAHLNAVLILAALLAVCAANAQSTKTPPQSPEPLFPGQNTLRATELFPDRQEVKLNEAYFGHLTFSGIGIELVKAGNPLQLINPAAPAAYGYADDNVVRDPITGRASGLKVFSLQF